MDAAYGCPPKKRASPTKPPSLLNYGFVEDSSSRAFRGGKGAFPFNLRREFVSQMEGIRHMRHHDGHGDWKFTKRFCGIARAISGKPARARNCQIDCEFRRRARGCAVYARNSL